MSNNDPKGTPKKAKDKGGTVAVIILLIIVIVLVLLFLFFGKGLGFGGGSGSGSPGTPSANSSQAAESAQETDTQTAAETSSETAADSDSGSTSNIVRVTVDENDYVYNNSTLTLDEFMAQIADMENITVNITDDNSSLSAWNELTAALEEKNIPYTTDRTL